MVFDSRPVPNEAEAAAIQEMQHLLSSDESPVLVPPADGPALDSPARLLRFVRGYGCKPTDAANAFRHMLAYRAAHRLEAARAEMYAASSADGQPLWPIELPRFKPIVDLIGDGLARRIGESACGNPATLVLLHHYDLRRVIQAGLTALLVNLQQYLDEWWSIELDVRSAAAGKLLARDDIIYVAKIGLFQFDLACARVFSQALAGAKHYPETVAHIMSTGNGKALVAMYNAVIRPFMPQHTKEKILVLGKDLNAPSIRDGLDLDEATMQRLLEATGWGIGQP